MQLAVTGHRLDKLGGYSPIVFDALVEFAGHMLKSYKPTKVITGMALGWDQAVAKACCQLNVPYLAAVPFVGQDNKWPKAWRLIYLDLLYRAKEQVIVCQGDYASWKMQRRNEWMVDNCDCLIALWDGTNSGTKNCVTYAQNREKKIELLWDNWLMFRQKKF